MIEIAGISLHLYGLIIGLGVLVAWEIAQKEAERRSISLSYFNRLVEITVLGGILGARVYHVAHYWNSYYANNLIKILFFWEGGLGIWGAVIGGLLFLLGYTYIYSLLNKLFRVNIMDVIDSVILGLPLAQAIGRLGNLFNNELWGTNGEPLFLYESVLNLFLFGLMYRSRKYKTIAGFLLGVYLFGYGVIRLSLDHLRATGDVWKVQNISVAVILSLVSILGGGWLVFKKRQS